MCICACMGVCVCVSVSPGHTHTHTHTHLAFIPQNWPGDHHTPWWGAGGWGGEEWIYVCTFFPNCSFFKKISCRAPKWTPDSKFTKPNFSKLAKVTVFYGENGRWNGLYWNWCLQDLMHILHILLCVVFWLINRARHVRYFFNFFSNENDFLHFLSS